jgi:ribosome-binding protein aMBF1 (putative translation factor)
MSDNTRLAIDHRSVELDGIRYVILRETVFELLCQKAEIQCEHPSLGEDSSSPGLELDRSSLAEKLVRRRRAAGLSQAELARRAGVRPETLNRIERGRTTPDFATVRKLVVAIGVAERQQAARSIPSLSYKEPQNVIQQ